MTPHEKLTHIWSAMNDSLRQFGPVYIAGGAVRDTLMNREPKDYDTFVLSPLPYKEIGPEIMQALSLHKKVKVRFEWHQSEPFLVETISVADSEIQVMVNPAADINALLDTFDWNVSLFAYGAEGYVNRTDVADIVAGGELKLQKLTFPYSTLRRGYRFSERFGMRFPRKTVDTIIQAIQDRKKTGFEETGNA